MSADDVFVAALMVGCGDVDVTDAAMIGAPKEPRAVDASELPR